MSQFIHSGTPVYRILPPGGTQRWALAVFAVLGLAISLPHQSSLAEEASAESSPEQLEFFEKQVRPLLAEHCYSCHSSQSKRVKAGLRVDSRDSLLKGGDSGESMVPGDPDGSLLIDAVRYESYEMPPKGKLADAEIKVFEDWVRMGAPWPKETPPEHETPGTPEFDIKQRRGDHWVWRPITPPTLPQVSDDQWPRSDLDRFILARLEDAGLKPAPDTDRSALIRRLFFDLTGLPPSAEAAEAFLADSAPDAVERLVDQLLESPHFGERWGRHWLDLVRYAESRGHEFDNDALNAFQYRDYIIRALNEDVPYDQIVREHLAGDLLPEPRLLPGTEANESILGTGFWFLGEWVHSPVDIRKDESDRFDNMIDVMSKTFLGMTVSCARCHDHKFDAISTADYYSLCGYLQSSDFRQVRFESLEANRNLSAQLDQLDASYIARIQKLLEEADVNIRPESADTELPAAAKQGLIVDYGHAAEAEFMQDGFLFGQRPAQAGRARIEKILGKPTLGFHRSDSASSDAFWDGLESVSEKGVQNRSRLSSIPRSGRTLRTPTFELTDPRVACLVRGKGHVVACVDSHRMIAGPLHGQTIRPIKAKERWVELNLERYLGHRLHLEFTPDTDAALEVMLVVQGVDEGIKQQLLDRFNGIDKGVAEAAQAIAPDTRALLDTLATSWADQRAELQSNVVRRSQVAMAMMDGTGEDEHVLIRGNSSKPGEIEPRHFLSAISGSAPMAITRGSGRLELAAAINAPDNPLTARVIVNRLFHYLMGRGIVPTTDDFGVLGQRPTHPELLDYLASRFTGQLPKGGQERQSLKSMIRYIVLSRTYQMSSREDEQAVAKDPKNLLWHHRPPKRLEGEAIRDALLTVSGRLDPTVLGASVPIHLTAFMDGRGRPGKSGPLDGQGRRSIYTAVRRNFISPSMLAFDTPVPFSTMGRRNISNVPAQALILLNDPLVLQLAQNWGERALQAEEDADDRIRWMYLSSLARLPSTRELTTAKSFLEAQAEQRNIPIDSPDLWKDFAHVLINTKEFIFLR